MKNCLVIIRNKKLNINYGRLDKILRVFSAGCIYFDKIAFVGFDSSKGISDQLMECRNQCENCFVLCEDRQREVIYDYLQKIYNSSFDGRFYLSCGQATVCLCSAGEDEGAFAEKCVRLMNEKYGVSYDKFYVKTVCAPAELINGALEKAHREGQNSLTVRLKRLIARAAIRLSACMTNTGTRLLSFPIRARRPKWLRTQSSA